MDIWEVLEIKETLDKKAIKKAYAKKLKITRPDQDAEAFQDLHTAYKVAIYLSDNQINEKNHDLVNEAGITESTQEESTLEIEDLPVSLEEVEEQTDYEKNLIIKVELFTETVLDLLTDSNKRDDVNSWENLFHDSVLLDTEAHHYLSEQVFYLVAEHNSKNIKERNFNQKLRIGIVRRLDEVFGWTIHYEYFSEKYSEVDAENLLSTIENNYEPINLKKALKSLKGSAPESKSNNNHHKSQHGKFSNKSSRNQNKNKKTVSKADYEKAKKSEREARYANAKKYESEASYNNEPLKNLHAESEVYQDGLFTDRGYMLFATYNSRVMAFVLDIIFFAIIIFTILYFVRNVVLFNVNDFLNEKGLYFFIMTTVLFFTPVFEALFGASPGKYIMGLKLVDKNAKPVRVSIIFYRKILISLSHCFFIVPWVFVGILVNALFSRSGMLHDKLTKTYIVNYHKYKKEYKKN